MWSYRLLIIECTGLSKLLINLDTIQIMIILGSLQIYL